MANTSLTFKQERFAQEYVKLGNASEAYRIVYDASDWTEHALNVEASRALAHPEISLRIESIKDAAYITVESLVGDLYSIFKKTGKDGVKVQALKEVAELLGYKVQRTEAKNLNINVSVEAKSFEDKYPGYTQADKDIVDKAFDQINEVIARYE